MSATHDYAALTESTTNVPSTVVRSAAQGLLSNDTGILGSIVSFKSGLPSNPGQSGTFGARLSGLYGDLILNADGSYTYEANNANRLYQGQAVFEYFSYTVRLASGELSTAMLEVKITGTNDGPVAVADVASITEGTHSLVATITGDVTPRTGAGADYDPDTCSQFNVTGVALGNVGAAPVSNVGNELNGTYGWIKINADGSYTYKLDNARAATNNLAAGATAAEVITYAITDNQNAKSFTTLTITITGTADCGNSPPVAVADTNSIVEGTGTSSALVTGDLTPTSGAGRDTDPDAGDILTVTSIGAGTSNGTGTSASSGYGTVTVGSNGSYTYTLRGTGNAQTLGVGQTANDVFTYVINDGHGGTSATTLTIRITGTNDAPVAVADKGNITEGTTSAVTSITGDVTPTSGDGKDYDVDNGSSFSVTGVVLGSASTAPGSNVGTELNGTYGWITINADGSYTYKLDNARGATNNLAGGTTAAEVITYAITDDKGAKSFTTLTITITGTADGGNATIGGDQRGDVKEDTTQSDTGVLTVSDPDAGQAKFQALSSVAGTYGSFSLTTGGTWTYNLSNSASGVQSLRSGETKADVFTVTTADGSTSQVSVVVTGTNDQPIARADSGQVREDATLTVSAANGVLSNDSDPDVGDSISIYVVGYGANTVWPGSQIGGGYGYLTLNSDGGYTYSATKASANLLAEGQTAQDVFWYNIKDSSGAVSTTSLTISITGTNDAPVAVADRGNITEGTTSAVTSITGDVTPTSGEGRDYDVDNGSSFNVTGVVLGSASTAPVSNVGTELDGTYGKIQINADGSYTYKLDNSRAATNAIAAGATAAEVITYAITDDKGAKSFTTLTITITGTADGGNATIGGDQRGDVKEDTTLCDTGVLTVSDPDAGQAKFQALSDVAGTYGRFSLTTGGTWTYNLSNSASGVQSLRGGETKADVFTVTTADGSTSQVSVVVTGTNDAAVITGTTTGSVTVGAGATATATLVVTDADAGESGFVAANLSGTYGSFNVTTGGQWTYQVNPQDTDTIALAQGQTATEVFTVSSIDGTTKAVTVTVTGINDAPVAVADRGNITEGTTSAVTSITGDVTPTSGEGRDYDVDNGSSFNVTGVVLGSASTAPVSNVGTELDGTYGKIQINADGSYTYKLDNSRAATNAIAAGATAAEVITYAITDDKGAKSFTTLTITITGTADGGNATIGGDQRGDVKEDTTQSDTGVLTVSDPDPGQAKFQALSDVAGTYGRFSLTTGGTWTYNLSNSASGVQSLRGGETKADVFTVTTADGSTSQVSVVVTGTNDQPIARADSGQVREDATLTVSAASGVLSNDSDPDVGDSISIYVVGYGSNTVWPGSQIGGEYGYLTLNSDGGYTYAATKASANLLAEGQTAQDVFWYNIKDSSGAVSTTSLTISITGTNDAPVAMADTSGITEASTTAVVTITGDVTPGIGQAGGDYDPDNGGSFNVTGVVLGNASAAPTGSVGVELNGTYGRVQINADGTYTYKLDNSRAATNAIAADATAAEVITYAITDDKGAKSFTTLTIRITGTNDGPTAVSDNGEISEDLVLSVSAANGILKNDTDPDGDTLSVIGVRAGDSMAPGEEAPVNGVGASILGSYGSLVMNANGSYTYTPDSRAQKLGGQYSAFADEYFKCNVSDGHGGTSMNYLVIRVNGLNDAPVAVADVNSLSDLAGIQRITVTGDATPASGAGADYDVDNGSSFSVTGIAVGSGSGLTLTNVVSSGPAFVTGAYGRLTMGQGGDYSYVSDAFAPAALAAGETATDVFTYVITDNNSATSATTITITITGANDGPVAVADVASMTEGTNSTVTSIAGDVTPGASGQDCDVDHNSSFSVSGVAVGSVNSTPSGNVGSELNGTYGWIKVNADGSYTYKLDNARAITNNLGAGVTAAEVITYAITDNNSAQSYTTLTITITGTAEGLGAVADSNSIVEDTHHVGGRVTDNDGGIGLSVTGAAVGTPATAPSGNLANFDALRGSYGDLYITSDGGYQYNLRANVVLAEGQTANEVFTYTVRDSSNATATATLTIKVTGTYDTPTAVADTGAVNELGSLSVNAASGIIANDFNPDGTLRVSLVGKAGDQSYVSPGNVVEGQFGTLTLQADGSYSYSAGKSDGLAAGQVVIDEYWYNVWDGRQNWYNTLKISVTGTNDAPIIGGVNTGSVTEDGALLSSGLLSISDADTGQSSFRATSATGTFGNFAINSAGSWTYTLNNSAANVQALNSADRRNEVFTVTTADGTTSTVTVVVSGVADNPDGTDKHFGTGTAGWSTRITAADFGFKPGNGNDTLAAVKITGIDGASIYDASIGRTYGLNEVLDATALSHTLYIAFQSAGTQNLTRAVYFQVQSSSGLWDPVSNVLTGVSYDPLLLDLNGDGVVTVGGELGVRFDMNGDGIRENIGWADGNDGFLVRDSDGNGLITSGAEMFGNFTDTSNGGQHADGFAALADLDTNGDGFFDMKDTAWAEVKVWRDVNMDGVSQADELLSLTQAGVAGIGVAAQEINERQADNALLLRGAYLGSDGQAHEIADVSFGGGLGAGVETAANGSSIWHVSSQDHEAFIERFDAEWDTLDLRDVLGGRDGALGDYLYISKVGQDTVIEVKTADKANVANHIVLENVDLLGGHSEQQLIHELLQKNHLIND